jgi:hypothetical protein
MNSMASLSALRALRLHVAALLPTGPMTPIALPRMAP